MAHSFHEVIDDPAFVRALADVLSSGSRAFQSLELVVRDEFADREKLRLAIGVPDGLPPESVSISHTPRRGGFVRANSPVGFDLEEASRVLPKVIARVSTETEVQAAPSPALLWCAKEAGFKLLRTRQLMSEVHVSSWREVATSSPSAKTLENLRLWSCKLDEDPSAIGVAVELSGTALCIFARP